MIRGTPHSPSTACCRVTGCLHALWEAACGAGVGMGERVCLAWVPGWAYQPRCCFSFFFLGLRFYLALPSCLIEKKGLLVIFIQIRYPQNLEPKKIVLSYHKKKQWFLLLPSPLTDDKPPKTGGLKTSIFMISDFSGQESSRLQAGLVCCGISGHSAASCPGGAAGPSSSLCFHPEASPGGWSVLLHVGLRAQSTTGSHLALWV